MENFHFRFKNPIMQRVQLQQAMQNRRARLFKQQGTPPSSCNSEESKENLQLTQKVNDNDQFTVSYSVPYLQSKIPIIIDESMKPDESEISLAQRQVTFAPTATLDVQSSQFTIQSPQSRKLANQQEINALDGEFKELQELYKSTSIYSSTSGSQSKNHHSQHIARPGNVLSDGKSSKNNILAQNFNNNMYGQYKSNSQSDTISQLNTSPLRTEQSRSKSANYNSQQLNIGSLSRSQNFSTTSNERNNYNHANRSIDIKNSVSDILTDQYQTSESNATIKDFLIQQELKGRQARKDVNSKPQGIFSNNKNINIPVTNTSNDKLKQQIIQQEKIITEYRDECERLQKQVQQFQQAIPEDERSKDGLIQRLKQDVVNLRSENDAYKEKYEQTIRDLVIQVQKLGDLNEEKKFMLVQFNEAVTGQKKHFDFEAILMQIQKWSSEFQSGQKNDQFLIQKVQEAAEDMQYMKNELELKNKTIAEQKARLVELEGQVLKGATHASLKQELTNKIKQLEKKNDEVNQLRKELLDTNAKLLKQTKIAQSTQNKQNTQNLNEIKAETFNQEKIKYETTIQTLQEQVKLLQQKLLNQDEEHLKRLKSMSNAEDERVAKIRSTMDDQLIDLRKRINDLTLENEVLKAKTQNAEQKYENLVKQYEVEKMQEYEKRLNKLEAVPESKYMNDVVQRAVLAENQLKIEREQFQKTCQQYQVKLQEYQEEIQQLVQELEYLM